MQLRKKYELGNKKKSKVIGSCQPESGDKLAGRRYNSQMNFNRGDILNVKREICCLFDIIIYRFRQDLLIFKEIFFLTPQGKTCIPNTRH